MLPRVKTAVNRFFRNSPEFSSCKSKIQQQKIHSKEELSCPMYFFIHSDNYTNEEHEIPEMKNLVSTCEEIRTEELGLEKLLFTTDNIPRKVSIRDFKVKKDLGKGAFGKVCCVYLKGKHEQLFAMKILKKSQIFRNNLASNILLEKNILLKNKCNFIVNLFCAFQTTHKLYMIMEYIPGGDLYSLLRKFTFLSEEVTKFYVSEIVLAIEYLHEQMGVIYRDLKPENILLTSDGHIKITDFGLSKETFLNEETYTFAGTPEYLAPEIIQRKGHTKAVDWWSLGILLYEMLCGFSPFNIKTRIHDKKNFYEMQKRILKVEPVYPSSLSPEAKDLIEKLLTKDYKVRLGTEGAKSIKQHPFFKGIDWEAMNSLKISAPILIENKKNFASQEYSIVESKYFANYPAIKGFSLVETDCTNDSSS